MSYKRINPELHHDKRKLSCVTIITHQMMLVACSGSIYSAYH
jgi:hypothetical protein